LGEVRNGDLVKGSRADYGTEAWEILGERVEHAKPILAIINLKPLEAGQSVIRLDDISNLLLHGSAAHLMPHAVTPCQRLHNHSGHPALQV
jgi:hypothetical protein